jgi:hypothetical protein
VRSWFLLSVFIFLSGTINLVAQDRCATVHSNEYLQKQLGLPETKEDFEQWVEKKIAERELKSKSKITVPYVTQATEATLKIPVVVHVVHNGEALGVGANVSDARITSQLKILNDDFNRLNTDKIKTPAAFETVSGSMDIEFVLAKSAPDGTATTGIVRVNGGRSSWSVPLDPTLSELKSKSYWNSANYLNLWVTHLSDNYIGLAQYPTLTTGVNGLSGLGERLATTDGVVIDYTAFGLGSQDPDYNLGRTVTHEVAHFLGLRHIWGDESGCGADDFVTDTPMQGSASIDYCPVAGTVKTDACTTTSPGVMYQNFMDYTDDACMNLFTLGQVVRMQTILENNAHRASLLVSPGLNSLSGLNEDLEITSINFPPATCTPNTTVEINLKNNSPEGVTISSFKVNYKMNAEATSIQEYSNLAIASGSTYSLSVTISLADKTDTLSLDVNSPNNYTDVNPDNSTTVIYTALISDKENLPHRENFDNPATTWISSSPLGGTSWENINSTFNQAGYFKGYNNAVLGEEAWLISPQLNFSYAEKASLYFDYSYGWDGVKNDRLKILASTDCGQTFDKVLFNLAGQQLSIFTDDREWFPLSTDDWKRAKYVNLNSLAGESNVILAVVAENAGGNNIFIDNLEFYLSDTPQIIDTYAIYWIIQGNSVLANISFDLPEPQPVKMVIMDMTGKQLLNTTLVDVFHQTFTLPVDKAPTGLYIVRLQIGTSFYTSKIYLAP